MLLAALFIPFLGHQQNTISYEDESAVEVIPLFYRAFVAPGTFPEQALGEGWFQAGFLNASGSTLEELKVRCILLGGEGERIFTKEVTFKSFDYVTANPKDCRPFGAKGFVPPLANSSFRAKMQVPDNVVQQMTGYWIEPVVAVIRYKRPEPGDFGAVLQGGPVALERILKNDPKFLTRVDTNGNTLLHLACFHGIFQLIKPLVKAGAKVNVRNKFDITPLHYAAVRSFVMRGELAQPLVSAGADVNAKSRNSGTPLAAAARFGCAFVVKVLLDKGAKPALTTSNWLAPVVYALESNSPQCLRLLLDAGANPNPKDEKGRTPLYRAVLRGNLENIGLLLDAKANVNLMSTALKETPLHAAARNNVIAAVPALLEAGVNKRLKNASGKTAEQLARQLGYPEIATMIKNG